MWTAQAALFCCGRCVEVGLAGKIRVKSSCIWWRRGVVYSPLLLIGGVFMAAHSLNVSWIKTLFVSSFGQNLVKYIVFNLL